MSIKFKNIAIIGRQNTTGAAKTLSALIKYLQTKKINVALEHDTATIIPNCKVPTIPREKLKNNCDLIIVVGGDGSILSAARIAASQNLPIVGINRGNLGFLTDITPSNLTKIDEILAGKYLEEHRFLLTVTTENQNKLPNKSLALNDITFFSYITGRMIEFAVYIDQQFLCNYRSDGLIIATPTGSTAHALSSGGPIIHPTLKNIVLVPVLSHNLSSRPIVISNKSNIEIAFNENNLANLLVLCDGQTQTNIHSGPIKISKAKERLRLLHPTDYNYFETLRTKLNWEKENKKMISP